MPKTTRVRAHESHNAKTGKEFWVPEATRETAGGKKPSKKATVAALAQRLADEAKGVLRGKVKAKKTAGEGEAPPKKKAVGKANPKPAPAAKTPAQAKPEAKVKKPAKPDNGKNGAAKGKAPHEAAPRKNKQKAESLNAAAKQALGDGKRAPTTAAPAKGKTKGEGKAPPAKQPMKPTTPQGKPAVSAKAPAAAKPAARTKPQPEPKGEKKKARGHAPTHGAPAKSPAKTKGEGKPGKAVAEAHKQAKGGGRAPTKAAGAKPAPEQTTAKKPVKPTTPAAKPATSKGAPAATHAAGKGKPASGGQETATVKKKGHAATTHDHTKAGGPAHEGLDDADRAELIAHPLYNTLEANLAKHPTGVIDIHQALDERAIKPGDPARSESLRRRYRARQVFDQHLAMLSRKRQLEARRDAATDPAQKADYEARLAPFKGYTEEVTRRLHDEVMASLEPKILAEARSWMHKLNLPAHVDEKGRPAGHSFYADMAQEARLKAWDIVKDFDPYVRSSNLAQAVEGGVKQALFRKWRGIVGAGKVSQRDESNLIRLKDVKEKLAERLGRDPSDEETAMAMDTESKEVKRLTALAHTVIAEHLDRAAGGHEGEEGGETVGALVADPKALDPEQILADREYGERVRGLMTSAIKELSGPRAPHMRFALVEQFKIPDGGAAMREVAAAEKLPEYATALRGAEKELKRIYKEKHGTAPVTKDAVIRHALQKVGVAAGKAEDDSHAYKKMANLYDFGGDWSAMLTTPRTLTAGDKKADTTGGLLFARLGYSPEMFRQMAFKARQQIKARQDVADFEAADLRKGLTDMLPWTPELLLYRSLSMGPDDMVAIPEVARVVTMWEPSDLAIMKSLADCSNVWTMLDPMNDLVIQMVVDTVVMRPGAMLDEVLAKGIGSEMERLHPGGHWVTMHGHAIFIDKAGTIQAGPQGFVGKPMAHLNEHLASGGELGEHSHPEEAKTAAEHKYALDIGGKKLHVKMTHAYTPESKQAAEKHTGHGKNFSTEIHSIEDEHGKPMYQYDTKETGPDGKERKVTKFTFDEDEAKKHGKGGKAKLADSADAVMQHFGLDNKKLNKESGKQLINENMLRDLHNAIANSQGNEEASKNLGKMIQKRKEQQSAAEAKGGGSVQRAGAEAVAKTKGKENNFKETGENARGGKVFTAHMHDGQAVEIHTNAEGKVQGGYWGQLLGDHVIQSADDLNRKLKSLAGSSSLVHLTNGDNHWMLSVTYDHNGTPVINEGPLKGKRLHEVMGEHGGLRHYSKPVEYNGKKLFAGYDPASDRVTARGNWSMDKVYDHFDAHTEAEKAHVRELLAKADKEAHADLPTLSLGAGLTADEKRAMAKQNKQRAKEGLEPLTEPERPAVLSLPDDPQVVSLAEAINEAGYGSLARLDNEKLHAIARDFHSKHGVLGGDGEGGLSEDQVKTITDAHRIARVLNAMQQEGYGSMQSVKGGKRGIVIPLEAVDRVSHLLGGMKLRGDVVSKINEAREKLVEQAAKLNDFEQHGSKMYGPDDGQHEHAIPGLVNEIPGIGKVGFTRHQQKLIHHYLHTGRSLSALGVGNGKTSSALAAAELKKHMNPEASPKKYLIVVPGNAQAKAWQDDAKKFFGMNAYAPKDAQAKANGTHHEDGQISFGKDVGPNSQYHVVTAALLQRKDAKVGGRPLGDVLSKHGYSRADLERPEVQEHLRAEEGVHPDELRTDEGDFAPSNKLVGGKHLAQHLKDLGFDGVIVDEAHTLNRLGSDQGAGRSVVDAYIHGLNAPDYGVSAGQGRAKGVMALTGTPVQNHLGEMYQLVNMTHRGLHDLQSQKEFVDTYGHSDENTGQLLGINPAKEQELGNKLARYMVTSTSEDLADEVRPPSADIQDVHIPLGEEHNGEIEDIHNEIHSLGGDEDTPRKGALAAIARGETAMQKHKREHVENKIREILTGDPSAKIILASNRREGQEMLRRSLAKVLGEFGQGDKVHSHMKAALADVDKQIGAEMEKHGKLRAKLEGQHADLAAQALRHRELSDKKAAVGLDASEEAEHGSLSPAARQHQDLTERLAGWAAEPPTVAALSATRKGLLKTMGDTPAERLGYDYREIRAQTGRGGEEPDEEEGGETDMHTLSNAARTKAVDDFNNDESVKGIVISSKIASSGVNLGRGTHIVDLDGHFNPAQLEQLYARHARLRGSMPTAIVHRFITKAHESLAGRGIGTVDEKKAAAVTRKQNVITSLKNAARKHGTVSTPNAPATAEARFMGHPRGSGPRGRTGEEAASESA